MPAQIHIGAFSCNFTWLAFHLSPRKRKIPSRNPICSYLIIIDPIQNRIEPVPGYRMLDSAVFDSVSLMSSRNEMGYPSSFHSVNTRSYAFLYILPREFRDKKPRRNNETCCSFRARAFVGD